MAASSVRPPGEVLEREERTRRPAAWTAVAGATLLALAAIIEQVLNSSAPDLKAVDVVQALAALQNGSTIPASFAEEGARFTLDNATLFIVVAVVRAVAYGLFAAMTVLLLRGARERGGNLPTWLDSLVVGAFAVFVITTLVGGMIQVFFYGQGEDVGFVPGRMRDLYESDWSWAAFISPASGIATLVIGIAVSLAAVQAMRVGMLPRVLGWMGILVGIVFVLPIDQGGLLRAVWFGGVAFLVAGRLPQGLPEAWTTGRAVVQEPRQPPEPSGAKS